VSTSNLYTLYPRHNQGTHTTGPNQLNRLIYRYINTEQTYIYQESITSKSVVDLTSQQTPLTKIYIYITAIKPSVSPVHLITVQLQQSTRDTCTQKKPSPIWGILPKVLTKLLAKLPMAT
jgi:hypothetical protein